MPRPTRGADRTERLFWLHNRLLEAGAEGVPAQDLAQVYENRESGVPSRRADRPAESWMPAWRSERKTLARDRRDLEKEWGARIEYDAGRRAWILREQGVPPSHLLPALPKGSPEETASAIARILTASLSGPELIGALQDTLPSLSDSRALDGISVVGPSRLLPRHPDDGVDSLALLSACWDAVRGQRLVTFHYRTPWRETAAWRRVEAWHLLWAQGGWYLVGRVPGGKLAMWALTRMAELPRILEERFDRDEAGCRRLAEMLAPVPQVYRTGKLSRIVLRVSAEVEPVLRDRGWDDEAEMRWLQLDDGSWSLRMRAFLDGPTGWCTRDAARFVLSLGPGVRVESPAELRACVLAMAREILEGGRASGPSA